ncbi:MAG: YihY/virulence factor BrkB family protein, partial [Acidimicrobiia bacterium]
QAGIIGAMQPTESPARSPFGLLLDILKTAAKEFAEDKAGRQAAALAYYTLFSLVPLLFVAVAVTAITLGPPRDALPLDPATGTVACERATNIPIAVDSDRPLDRFVSQLDDVAGESVSDPVRVVICQARENAGASLSVGLAVAAFTASGIFLHVQGVLNSIFHAPEERVRGLVAVVRKRLVALAAALALAIVVVVPVVAVGAIQFLIDLLPIGTAWMAIPISLLVPVVSLAVLVTTVALTFRVLTQAEIPWRAARRGGAATSLSGLLSAFLVGQYLASFGSGSSTFGVLGGLAILLFFFYLMWIVYLFGAEVTKVYADYLEFGDVMPPHQRAESRFVAEVTESVASAARRSPPGTVNASVFAFLTGLAMGWRRRNRT